MNRVSASASSAWLRRLRDAMEDAAPPLLRRHQGPTQSMQGEEFLSRDDAQPWSSNSSVLMAGLRILQG